MKWIAPLVSGFSGLMSLITVVLVARMSARGDREKWLREERVRSAIQLKQEVSRVRVQYSRPAATTRSDRDTGSPNFDFADVNAAMAHLDLVGPASVVSEVEVLRQRLREFVRAGSENRPEWRARRDALDATVDSIVEIVRKDVIS